MNLLLLLFSSFTLLVLATSSNTFKIDNDWQFQYSLDPTYITVTVTGTNKDKGAIAVGFGGKKMEGVDVVSFSLDNSNKILVEDRNYINHGNESPPLVKLDTESNGTNDVIDDGSTFDANTGAWVAKFKKKINSQDPYDVKIIDGQSTQITLAQFKNISWGDQHVSVKESQQVLTSKQMNSCLILLGNILIISFILL